MKNIIVGITGASGLNYARVLVRELYQKDYCIYLIVTEPGKIVMETELGIRFKRDDSFQEKQLKNLFEIPHKEKDRLVILDNRDLAAPVASGSFRVEAMVVIPCSMATISSIARGSSQDLLERAADVTIKEGRKLILVPRETPLSSIHLRNMLSLSESGVTLLPAMPAFYHQPRSLEDIFNFVAGRVLENLGMEHNLYDSWGSKREKIAGGKEFEYKIGILQLISHLDDTVEGFKEGLSSFREAEFTWDYRNVEGKVPLLGKEAEDLVSKGMDLIFACTTPAAKAAQEAAESRGTPLVFTPVLDPVKVGLVASWESSGNNLTGVSGLVSPELKLKKYKEVYPRLKKLFIIYERDNPNTAIEMEYLLKSVSAKGLKAEFFEVVQGEDLAKLKDKKYSPGTGLFVPISPLIEQNISQVISAAEKHKLPLMVPNEEGVKRGALLGLVASHYDLGFRAGLMAADILKGKDPADIPIEAPQDPRLVLNLDTAGHLNLKVPGALLEESAATY
ncbi:MAG: UbiX family flavin prenyltransferase [Candidatus Syntrophonatronum acetioxidans]|uniref:Flavin prenyltransferase UbiX n=1 Tax=Candidatus Syntrophonatronum acetioxidans TaxID=1795816 RepID=A0A424YEI6_9FIRM|nr:MAG: UbiX family flavin prenyltransferase [Candidatus Syntrophonatronum acetioxidans]